MLRIFKIAAREFSNWVDTLIMFLPGRVGTLVRAQYLQRLVGEAGKELRFGIGVKVTGHRNVKLGNNVSVMQFSSLYAHNDGILEIGNNVSINSNTCLAAADKGKIIIGNNVLIAQNVVLRASDHEHTSSHIPIIKQGHTGGVITVEDDVWIAANSVITRNVRICSHSIVAAGAVVTKDVEPYSIVGGVPAKLVRKRI